MKKIQISLFPSAATALCFILFGSIGENECLLWESMRGTWGICSMNLMKKIKPDVVNIARYAVREGTIAAKMKQLPLEVMTQRSRAMTKVFREIILENNRRWIGQKGKVIIDENGTLEGSWIGRNECYRPVVVKGDYKLGDIIDAEIFDATIFDLRGKEC